MQSNSLMMKKKNRFFQDPQNIIALGVTFISLCALIVSSIQTKVLIEERELMREYSRASVWPHLEIGRLKSQNPEDGSLTQFSLNLTNSGVGPAIITDAKVSYNDTIAHNWWHLFKIMGVPDSIDQYIADARFNGRVIKIGETIGILNLDNNVPLANEFFKRGKGLSIEIYYESIYGEKWKYKNGRITKLENFEGLAKEEQFY